MSILNSIASLFKGKKKIKKEEESSMPLKLYSFMITEDGKMRPVNIKASDMASAQEKVKTLHPNCKVKFLGEVIRSI